MSGTSWRAISVPTQKSNGDLPRASGLTASPGRAVAEGSQARILSGGPPRTRQPQVGLIGRQASTPDNAAYTIGAAPGNGVTVTIHCRLKQWSAIGTTHWFAAQGDHTFSTDLAWAASIHPNGRLRFAISPDGTNFFGPEATGGLPFAPGQEGWVRMGYENFLGLKLFVYQWSYDGINWVTINTDATLGAYEQPKDSAEPILCPGTFGESDQQAVTFELRVTVNTVLVTNPRFDTLSPRQPEFQDDQRRTWTVISPGIIGVA